MYRHVANLIRSQGDQDRQSEATAHYRAHVDIFPNDAMAWQLIAQHLGGGFRTDLADEATATAEQLLLAGTDEDHDFLHQ